MTAYKFTNYELNKLFYALWSEWGANGGADWKAAVYVIENGRANLALVYPDKFDESISPLDRRSRVVVQYFGADEVDYPQPGF